MAKENNSKRIILLGASVGKSWKIEQLSKRINEPEYVFEYEGEYQFDKSNNYITIKR
jgi:nicotinamide riboside kinase